VVKGSPPFLLMWILPSDIFSPLTRLWPPAIFPFLPADSPFSLFAFLLNQDPFLLRPEPNPLPLRHHIQSPFPVFFLPYSERIPPPHRPTVPVNAFTPQGRMSFNLPVNFSFSFRGGRLFFSLDASLFFPAPRIFFPEND